MKDAITIIICLLATFFYSHAQLDSLFQANIAGYDSAGVAYFLPEKLEPGDLFTLYHDYYFEDDQNTMVLERSWTDGVLGMQHNRYQQHFLGIPVEGAEFIEHASNGWLVCANGRVADGIQDVVSSKMPESNAFEYLSSALSGFEFAWYNSDWESQIQEDMNDPDATYLPTGQLIWALEDPTILPVVMGGENFRLAYTFEVTALSPSLHKRYYIDAITGELFREVELSHTNGPASLLYYSFQTIDTRWSGSLSKYILHADDNGVDIRTRYFSSVLPWGLTPDIKDSDDSWGSTDELGTTAHWVVSQAWNMFNGIPYNRAGLDDSGGEIRIEADWNESNAAYDQSNGGKDYLRFGTLDNMYLAALDVGGHEYGHGIDEYTAQLEYEAESGALDESFADIYGFLVERFAEGAVNDWTIGEDAVALRSLENPGLFDQPNTLGGNNWINPANTWDDFGGVHTNSGVQNFWFHLLADGGIGTNDNNDPYTVDAIGIDDAALIAYWSHTNFMTTNSTFANARANSVAAAILLFSTCSDEHRQTENAWAAVGVGLPSACPITTTPESNTNPIVEISLIPNPAQDFIKVSTNVNGGYDLELTSINGKVILSESAYLGGMKSLALHNVPPGMYIVTVIGKHGQRSTAKFVKMD